MPYMACIVPEPYQPLPPLRVLIAAPRGFCAGVDRAIQIVELARGRFGAPVYVRHQRVHNPVVVAPRSTLVARIHAVEHRLLPEVVQELCAR